MILDLLAAKSCAFNVSDVRRSKITATFQSLKHVVVEDIMGFVIPKYHLRNGPRSIFSFTVIF